jgi:hypothetical protein
MRSALHLNAPGLVTVRMVGFISPTRSMTPNKCVIPRKRRGPTNWGDPNVRDVARILTHAPKGCRIQPRVRMCLAPVIPAQRACPEGARELRPGSPWVSRNKRFALKGLELRTRSDSKVRSRFPLYIMAPSGLIRVRGNLPGQTLGYAFLATSGHGVETPKLLPAA